MIPIYICIYIGIMMSSIYIYIYTSHHIYIYTGIMMSILYTYIYIYIYIYILIMMRGSLNNFTAFFRMGTFIDSTQMKL